MLCELTNCAIIIPAMVATRRAILVKSTIMAVSAADGEIAVKGAANADAAVVGTGVAEALDWTSALRLCLC